MKKSLVAVLMAGSLSLGACTTTAGDDSLASAATGAAVGAAAGAGVGAVVGGISPIQGAAVGAVVGGLAGAVWADRNNDGYADGYVREGQYYEGTPSGWDSTLGRVATGAAVGGALGAGVGAVTGLGVLEGAIAGAAIGGIAGAVWADRDNDGRVDGYVREGRYYDGAPAGYQPGQTTTRRGERG